MEGYPVDNFFGELYMRGKPAETLKNFAKTLAGNDRESYIKAFENILQTETPEVLAQEQDEILETLDSFSQDPDLKYRAYVADNLINLCGTCVSQLDHSPGSFGSALLCTVLTVALRYLPENKRLYPGSHKTILYLIENGFLSADIIEESVCPVVLTLCKTKSDNSEEGDYLSGALGMIAKVSPIIGQQKTYDMFYEEFIKLTKSKSMCIRKQCAKVFPIICEVLGMTITEESMLPIFLTLCDDDIWGVRKICAEVMAQMSLLVSMEVRRKVLVSKMKDLLFDKTEWVILGALRSLGPFLATFAQPQIFGLAYDYRLDLHITNAADEKFKEIQTSPYGGQSNNAIILKNLEMYEQELESKFIPLSAANITDLRSEEKLLNIDEFLAEVSEPTHPYTHAIPITAKRNISVSDDVGFRCYVDDRMYYDEEMCTYVLHTKNYGPDYSEKNLKYAVSNDKDLKRFVDHVFPLKNNFNIGPVNAMKQMSSSNEDYLNELASKPMSKSPNWSALPLPPPPHDSENNNNEKSTRKDVRAMAQELEKLLAAEKHDNDNLEELQKFNSHQFWYIAPLDIDLANPNKEIDSSKSNIETETDLTNSNTVNGLTNSNIENDLTNSNTENDLTNSNTNTEMDEENERTTSCNSTVIATSDFDDGLECNKPTIYPIDPEMEWNLIEDFIYMKEVDNDVLFDCAYFFPAIIFTFGARFWPLFQPHYTDLCYHFTINVRKTMAASISQVAMTIGREYASNDLVLPYMYLFQDVDEVRMNAVKGFATFIKVIDPVDHPKLLKQIDISILPCSKKFYWRFRENVGFQLLKLIEIHEHINKKHCLLYMIGISFRLMIDSYDSVRKVGVDAFVKAFRLTQHKVEVLNYFRDKFANDNSWKRKQLYILTVDKMLAENAITVELFNDHVLQNLLDLSTHKVPNIRLYAGKCLSTTILSKEYFQTASYHEIIGIPVYKLYHDADRDVRESTSLQYISSEVMNLATLVLKIEELSNRKDAANDGESQESGTVTEADTVNDAVVDAENDAEANAMVAANLVDTDDLDLPYHTMVQHSPPSFY